ncbi:ATPase, partial [Streptomyces sp. H27-D2]|nr:ATPase [Streptomyces sp. H27-D2]
MTFPARASQSHPGGDAWVLGVDSGGSGVRVALGRASGGEPVGSWSSTTPVITGAKGIDAAAMLDQVVPAAEKLLSEAGAGAQSVRLAAACVGAAGMATLGDDLRARLPDALAAGITGMLLAARLAVPVLAAALDEEGAIARAAEQLRGSGSTQ